MTAPLPPAWPRTRQPVTRVAGVALSALIGLALLVLATAAAIPSMGVFGLYLLFVTSVVAGTWWTPRRRRAPVIGTDDRGEAGLSFPFLRFPAYGLSAAVGFPGLAMLIVAVGAAQDLVVMGVVLALGGVFFLWFAAIQLRLAPGRLVLTPAGVYQRSQFHEHFVPWDAAAVVGIGALQAGLPVLVVDAYESPASRARPIHRWLTSYEMKVLPFLAVYAYRLGGNAVAAYGTLGFYLGNPGHRAELGTEAALLRLTAGRD